MTADARSAAERMTIALQELGAIEDAEVRDRMEALIRGLVGLYGAGLARIVKVLDETPNAMELVRQELLEDELVSGLLILHNLHPQSLAARVEGAVAQLRQSLGSRVDIHIASADEACVALRLSGPEWGCGADALRDAVVRAIAAAVPDTAEVDVTLESSGPRLIQILRPPAAEASQENRWPAQN